MLLTSLGLRRDVIIRHPSESNGETVVLPKYSVPDDSHFSRAGRGSKRWLIGSAPSPKISKAVTPEERVGVFRSENRQHHQFLPLQPHPYLSDLILHQAIVGQFKAAVSFHCHPQMNQRIVPG